MTEAPQLCGVWCVVCGVIEGDAWVDIWKSRQQLPTNWGQAQRYEVYVL